MGKPDKAIAKIVLTVHYDLNEEQIESIKERLEGSIRYMVARGSLAGDEAGAAMVDTWECAVSVSEKY